MKTYKQYGTRVTPQTEAIPGSDQVENSADGFSWSIDDWSQLNRFLILGTEGGTYYIKEQKLTVDNAEAVHRCVTEDGTRTVATIVKVSQEGRAPKNDPALFALAMCAGLGDDKTRKAALEALPQVARIGTHLFHFNEYVEQFRGRGRSLNRAVASWYQDKSGDKLAYQVVKYQQRDGWSHRDLLRLAKPKPKTKVHDDIYGWIVGKNDKPKHKLLKAYEKAKQTDKPGEIHELIATHGLTREMIPNQFLNYPAVWAALLEKMPMTAMIRNVGKMTEVGLVAPMSEAAKKVVAELSNADRIKKARVHPLQILVAQAIYSQGHGMRGSLSWTPVPQIVDALDAAFYTAFQNVEPTNKNTMLALDVSGSMGWSNLAGMPLTPRDGSAALALVTANIEPNYFIAGFMKEFTPLSISKGMQLADAIKLVSDLDFGGTDCAIPMIYALQNKLQIETFVIYTDSETWAGGIHPSQALNEYRQKMGIPAKLIVVGMEANPFSIADPNDAGMLDIVGFDTATPRIISKFASSQ